MTSIMEFMQLCRLCLVKEQVNIPIFGEQGDIKDVLLKISACLPVKVSKEDKLPKKICDGCSYKLDLLYQFSNTSANAEKQLLTWLNQLNADTMKEDAETLTQAQVSQPVKQEMLDTADNGNETTKYLLQQQFEGSDLPATESHDENGGGDDGGPDDDSSDDEPLAKRRKRIIENKTETEHSVAVNSVAHMAVTKTEEASDSDGDDNPDDPEPSFVSVGTDDGQQPGPSGLGKSSAADIPTEDDDVENKTCKKCSKTYSTRRAFTRHRFRCNKEKTISCEMCDKKFKSRPELNQHVQAIHNEYKAVFTCELCDASFYTKVTYERHQYRHINTFRFKCDECGAKFNIKASLDHHIALKHKGIRYTCEQCGKSFATESYFRKHADTHRDGYVRPEYKCTVCEKVYNRRSSLAMHMDTHRNRYYVCEVCGKVVCSKRSLSQHVMLHTGEKPFTCEICGRSFNKQTIWKSHMRTHTKSKPFVCNICGKGFTQRTPLTVHLRYHTGEKPYSCDICQKRFFTRTLLKSHSKVHGIPLCSI